MAAPRDQARSDGESKYSRMFNASSRLAKSMRGLEDPDEIPADMEALETEYTRLKEVSARNEEDAVLYSKVEGLIEAASEDEFQRLVDNLKNLGCLEEEVLRVRTTEHQKAVEKLEEEKKTVEVEKKRLQKEKEAQAAEIDNLKRKNQRIEKAHASDLEDFERTKAETLKLHENEIQKLHKQSAKEWDFYEKKMKECDGEKKTIRMELSSKVKEREERIRRLLQQKGRFIPEMFRLQRRCRSRDADIIRLNNLLATGRRAAQKEILRLQAEGEAAKEAARVSEDTTRVIAYAAGYNAAQRAAAGPAAELVRRMQTQRAKLAARDAEISKLNASAKEQEDLHVQQLADKDAEIDELKKESKASDAKVEKLTADCKQLNIDHAKQLEDKDAEIARWKKQAENNETKVKELLAEAEQQQRNHASELKSKDGEIEKWKGKAEAGDAKIKQLEESSKKLQDDYAARAKSRDAEIGEWKGKAEAGDAKIKRLEDSSKKLQDDHTAQVESKDAEIEKWKGLYKNADNRWKDSLKINQRREKWHNDRFDEAKEQSKKIEKECQRTKEDLARQLREKDSEIRDLENIHAFELEEFRVVTDRQIAELKEQHEDALEVELQMSVLREAEVLAERATHQRTVALLERMVMRLDGLCRRSSKRSSYWLAMFFRAQCRLRQARGTAILWAGRWMRILVSWRREVSGLARRFAFLQLRRLADARRDLETDRLIAESRVESLELIDRLSGQPPT